MEKFFFIRLLFAKLNGTNFGLCVCAAMVCDTLFSVSMSFRWTRCEIFCLLSRVVGYEFNFGVLSRARSSLGCILLKFTQNSRDKFRNDASLKCVMSFIKNRGSFGFSFPKSVKICVGFKSFSGG